MNKDLKNILSNLNKDVEQDKLLQYLNDHLSEEEKHDVEKQILDDEFASDALEGLQYTKPAAIPSVVHSLNAGLNAHLQKNRKRKRNAFSNQGWIYFAIILLLLLAVVSFVVIRRLVG